MKTHGSRKPLPALRCIGVRSTAATLGVIAVAFWIGYGLLRASQDTPARTPPVAAEPASSEAPTTPAHSDADLVSRMLAQYADALTRMDVNDAVKAWPLADRAALVEAFSTLDSNRVVLDACAIEFSAPNRSVAVCRAAVEYVPKIGARDRHAVTQQWRFTMNKVGAEWTIGRADVVEDR